MCFLLVSGKAECLKIPEIAQCLNVSAYNPAGRKEEWVPSIFKSEIHRLG